MNNEGGGASRTTDPASGSSAATDVSLREFFKVHIDYESRITRLLFAFSGVAGAFAWSQIQRRLEILNHENARVAAIADQTVSADTYKSDKDRTDDERDKLDTWRSSVDEKFTKSISRDEFQRDTKVDDRAAITSKTAVWGAIAVALIVVLNFLAYQTLRHQSSTPSPTVTITKTVTTK